MEVSMTEDELSQIEAELRVTLPREYRELMLERSGELRACGCFGEALSELFLDAPEVINENTIERVQDSGTSYAFPNWWTTYFLVGTNGGGDYYCLRLDNEPGVWMIGSDCGGEAGRVSRTFQGYVDEALENCHERMRQEEAAARQREQFVEEAGGDDQHGSVQEWLSSSPHRMFDFLDRLGKVTPRKLRLFNIACCRRVWTQMTDECRRAVVLAEAHLAGRATPEQMASLREKLQAERLALSKCADPAASIRFWSLHAVNECLRDDDSYRRETPRAWTAVISVVACSDDNFNTVLAEHSAQADVLREIVGNPVQPARFDPRWRTAAVVELARTIDTTQAFERMPALAEALAQAGCDRLGVLKHCQRQEGHVSGCWVVDLILDRQTLEPDDIAPA
jgi:hypothetical protein